MMEDIYFPELGMSEKELMKKLPFTKATNGATGKTLDFSWYGRIPKGWRIAFGRDMLNEMAAEYNDMIAISNLGYIWYYGRVGDPDFKSAYACFKKAMDARSYVATYKIADMYHNGYYVEKDEKKYEELIEPLYFKVRSSRLLEDPVPEVCVRYAKIRSGRGEIRVAINIVDRDGIEALSVRSIAKDLSVSPMTIYNYVDNLQSIKKQIVIHDLPQLWVISSKYSVSDQLGKRMDLHIRRLHVRCRIRCDQYRRNAEPGRA